MALIVGRSLTAFTVIDIVASSDSLSGLLGLLIINFISSVPLKSRSGVYVSVHCASSSTPSNISTNSSSMTPLEGCCVIVTKASSENALSASKPTNEMVLTISSVTSTSSVRARGAPLPANIVPPEILNVTRPREDSDISSVAL